MALVQTGGGVTGLAGSIGGTVFARGRGGTYARARMKPVNPSTARQASARRAVSTLTRRWSMTLTQSERDGWAAWTAATLFTNRLGQPIQPPPISAYVMVNALRIQAGEPITPTAPLLPGWAPQPTFELKAYIYEDPPHATFYMTQPSAPYDPDRDDHLILFFDYLPAAPGARAVPRRARLCHVLRYIDAPPEFPYEFEPAWPITLGQLRTIGAVFIDEHNRVSNRYFTRALSEEYPI